MASKIWEKIYLWFWNRQFWIGWMSYMLLEIISDYIKGTNGLGKTLLWGSFAIVGIGYEIYMLDREKRVKING